MRQNSERQLSGSVLLPEVMGSAERIKLGVWVVLFLITVPTCLSLEITRLSIPKFVQNGSQDSIVLDCEYSYNLKEDKKLVVKWFHEDDPKPVYQWIPEFDSKLHSEKFRVNEDYVIPDGDKYTRSRALNIQRPTTELSGKYSCEVQSLGGSDAEEDYMTVYAEPSSVAIYYNASDGVVKVICEVEGVYPIPEISLYQIPAGMRNSVPIEDDELDFEFVNGTYELELSTNFTEEELSSGWFFGCNVEINGTNYTKNERISYIPGPTAEKQESDDSDDNGGSRCTEVLSLAMFLLTLLFLLT